MRFAPRSCAGTKAKNDLGIRVDLHEVFDEKAGWDVARSCIAVVDLAEQSVPLWSRGGVDLAEERGPQI